MFYRVLRRVTMVAAVGVAYGKDEHEHGMVHDTMRLVVSFRRTL